MKGEKKSSCDQAYEGNKKTQQSLHKTQHFDISENSPHNLLRSHFFYRM